MSLPEGQRKDELEATLHREPRFFERESARVREILNRDPSGGVTADNTSETPCRTPALLPEMDSPVLNFTGDAAAELILRTINCDVKRVDHALERDDFVQGTGQTIPDNTFINSDLEWRRKGKQILTTPIISPVALGLANYPTNWADIVDLEDSEKSNSVGLSNINLGGTAQHENSQAKAKDRNPIELTPSTNPKSQKGKRARKRAKRVIIQSELRRSVRISENPGTKHYTPKKDSKGGQPS